MALPPRPKQPHPTLKPTPSPASQARSASNMPARPLPEAGVDPRTLTPAQVMQLQRTVGNRAVVQYMRATPHPSQGNKTPPQGPPVIQRVEVTDDDIEKQWKKSQFKTIYLLKDGRLLAVPKGDSSDIEKEYAAYQKIASATIKTPNPELVDYKDKKALRMDWVEGTFIDFNKIDNTTVLYNLLVVTASTNQKVEFNEKQLEKLAAKKMKTNLANKETLQQMREELAVLLKAQTKMVINDIQAIVDHQGNLVVIDPVWAGDPKDLVVDKQMVEFTYQKIMSVFKSLGGKEEDINPKQDKEVESNNDE